MMLLSLFILFVSLLCVNSESLSLPSPVFPRPTEVAASSNTLPYLTVQNYTLSIYPLKPKKGNAAQHAVATSKHVWDGTFVLAKFLERHTTYSLDYDMKKGYDYLNTNKDWAKVLEQDLVFFPQNASVVPAAGAPTRLTVKGPPPLLSLELGCGEHGLLGQAFSILSGQHVALTDKEDAMAVLDTNIKLNKEYTSNHVFSYGFDWKRKERGFIKDDIQNKFLERTAIRLTRAEVRKMQREAEKQLKDAKNAEKKGSQDAVAASADASKGPVPPPFPPGDLKNIPDSKPQFMPNFILSADVVWLDELVAPLVETASAFFSEGLTVWYLEYQVRSAKTIDVLKKQLEKHKFIYEVVPHEFYHANYTHPDMYVMRIVRDLKSSVKNNKQIEENKKAVKDEL